MTSRDLAKKLLELPDLPVQYSGVDDGGNEFSEELYRDPIVECGCVELSGKDSAARWSEFNSR